MGVLKGFLYACAGLFALLAVGPLFIGALPLIVKLGLLVVFGGIGYATFRAAQKFNVAQSENQQVQLADTFKMLAERHGGSVPVEALMKATGDSKEGVQAKMRELMGRGICELDFGPNGEVLFKATPMDEARASLAQMSDRNRIG